MKLAQTITFALIAASLFGQTANPKGAVETRIIALENAWNQAQLNHDSKALDALVPANYVYTDYDGTVMNKAEFLADLKDPEYQASLVTNEGVKVYVYENAAVVTGTYHTKGTYKSKAFEHWGRFTDMWVYNDYKWQCIASHTNLIKK